MSKFYRLMTNNIGTTSFSINIVPHYCPRSKLCANGIFFSWQIKSHDYKNQNKFRINLTEHLKDALQTYIKTFKHVVIEIWALKENCSQWRNVNIEMHFATWQMITLLCRVCYDEKQIKTLFFWLLQKL